MSQFLHERCEHPVLQMSDRDLVERNKIEWSRHSFGAFLRAYEITVRAIRLSSQRELLSVCLFLIFFVYSPFSLRRLNDFSDICEDESNVWTRRRLSDLTTRGAQSELQDGLLWVQTSHVTHNSKKRAEILWILWSWGDLLVGFEFCCSFSDCFGLWVFI
jgi:hypothetical protein